MGLGLWRVSLFSTMFPARQAVTRSGSSICCYQPTAQTNYMECDPFKWWFSARAFLVRSISRKPSIGICHLKSRTRTVLSFEEGYPFPLYLVDLRGGVEHFSLLNHRHSTKIKLCSVCCWTNAKKTHNCGTFLGVRPYADLESSFAAAEVFHLFPCSSAS